MVVHCTFPCGPAATHVLLNGNTKLFQESGKDSDLRSEETHRRKVQNEGLSHRLLCNFLFLSTITFLSSWSYLILINRQRQWCQFNYFGERDAIVYQVTTVPGTTFTYKAMSASSPNLDFDFFFVETHKYSSSTVPVAVDQVVVGMWQCGYDGNHGNHGNYGNHGNHGNHGSCRYVTVW